MRLRGSHADDFYLRWIAANAVVEAIGLGTTFVAGRKLGPMLGDATEPSSIVGAAILAVVLGVALEGLVVGVAQESVLRRELRGLRPWSWTTATAIGAGVAWVVGMVPSTIVALNASADVTSPLAEPDALTTYTLAAVLGVVAGPILGRLSGWCFAMSSGAGRAGSGQTRWRGPSGCHLSSQEWTWCHGRVVLPPSRCPCTLCVGLRVSWSEASTER